MKRILVLSLLTVSVAAFIAPQALAADEEGKTKFSGEFRSRFEYVDNYIDFTGDDLFDVGDGLTFWPYRLRLGIEHQFAGNVKVFGEIQNAGHFGASSFPEIPDSHFDGLQPFMSGYPIATSLFDPAFGDAAQDRETLLYQGYVELGNLFTDTFSARIGRQEHTLGTQLLLGNNEFYNGISFDGARLMWRPEKFGLDAFYYKLNESYLASTDANLFGVAGNFELSKQFGGIDGYVIQYQNLADTDEIPAPSWLQWNDMALTTIGARWGRMVKTADDMKDGAFDWNIEYAMQMGESTYGAFEYDFGGSIIEGWFGWNFGTGGGRSRVHVGTLMASGQAEDEQATETGVDWNGFIPLFGNNWAYNRLGDLDLFDMTDIEDINLGYAYITANDKHKMGVMLHMLSLAEDVTIYDENDENPAQFSDLGMEIDFRYTFKFTDQTSFSAGYAYMEPGDVFEKGLKEDMGEVYPGADAVMRLWAQVRVRW